jgi:hypothetical protein
MVPFTVEIHPLTHPCLRHVVTIDLTSHERLQSRTVQNRCIQIHPLNRSSVLRSRVNRLFSLNQKIVFSIENRSSNLNISTVSMVVPSFVTANHFLEPLKGSLTFLYMLLCPSCLNGCVLIACSDRS